MGRRVLRRDEHAVLLPLEGKKLKRRKKRTVPWSMGAMAAGNPRDI
jgi:hypothetical protein